MVPGYHLTDRGFVLDGPLALDGSIVTVSGFDLAHLPQAVRSRHDSVECETPGGDCGRKYPNARITVELHDDEVR